MVLCLALEQQAENFEDLRVKLTAEKRKGTASEARKERCASTCLKETLEMENQGESFKEEKKLFAIFKGCAIKGNRTEEENTREARSGITAKKRYADLLARYDYDIGIVYTLRNDLLSERKRLEEEYAHINECLVSQRALYRQLKEEREQLLAQAFLERLENFCRNRAARIIQKRWRIHRERPTSKKRRSKK